MALEDLGVSYKSIFGSEINERLRKMTQTNFGTQISYASIFDRQNDSPSTPQVDLYLSGFPCQPFSSSGLRKGDQDPRGQIIPAILNYLRVKSPKIFILENVLGFVILEKGRVKKELMSLLAQLPYCIYDQVLNTEEPVSYTHLTLPTKA